MVGGATARGQRLSRGSTAVDEGKSSKGAGSHAGGGRTTGKGQHGQQGFIGQPVGSLGTARQSNVVNLESGIGLKDARGREQAQAAEGARNPTSGATACRDCMVSNRGAGDSGEGEKAAAHVSSEGRREHASESQGRHEGRPLRWRHSGGCEGATKETIRRVRVSAHVLSLEDEKAGGV
jgi:hypothetical protein